MPLHAHPAPRRPEPAPWRTSLLTTSAGTRLGLAALTLGGLWSVVAWALRA